MRIYFKAKAPLKSFTSLKTVILKVVLYTGKTAFTVIIKTLLIYLI